MSEQAFLGRSVHLLHAACFLRSATFQYFPFSSFSHTCSALIIVDTRLLVSSTLGIYDNQL